MVDEERSEQRLLTEEEEENERESARKNTIGFVCCAQRADADYLEGYLDDLRFGGTR